MLNKKAGFTLVELLVVIAIIGILISLILPALSKSKQKAKQTACASTMRQYALATQYYVNDWKFYPDAQKYFQPETGFLHYFDKDKEVWTEQNTRCPGDEKTEDLGRLADCVQGSVNVKVSIGINGNNCSDTRSMRATGPVAQWLQPENLKKAQPANVAFWMDFQYQGPDYDTKGETYPLTSPVMIGLGSPGGTPRPATSLNRYAFRHSNAMNVAFLDSHVGTIKLNKSTVNYGHDFARGVTWTKSPSHVVIPFGARPANATMGFSISPDVSFQ